MSYSSDRVREWRHRTKKRIVRAMGGKCVVCNYSKCRRALDLHHLNSEEKEFSFGKIMANPKRWDKLVGELRKCVLICCRCHAEVHNGLIKISKNVIRFNEEYVSYKKEKEMDQCPVCKGKKHLYNKTCSYSCAAKLSGKVNWDEINLEDLLISKNMSYSSIGRMLDISGNAVKKRAKKIGII